MRLNSSFLLLSRCLFNSKNKPVCQEHPENLNVHLLLIIRLIFNSTKITFFNIVWDTPSITVTSILYFTSISIFSGGLAKSLSISTPSRYSLPIFSLFRKSELNSVIFLLSAKLDLRTVPCISVFCLLKSITQLLFYIPPFILSTF